MRFRLYGPVFCLELTIKDEIKGSKNTEEVRKQQESFWTVCVTPVLRSTSEATVTFRGRGESPRHVRPKPTGVSTLTDSTTVVGPSADTSRAGTELRTVPNRSTPRPEKQRAPTE